MTNYIGIDLGTTFSAVAYIDQTGRPQIINNDKDENITPSVVAKYKGELIADIKIQTCKKIRSINATIA